MSTYDSTKDSLMTILQEIAKGKIQLPEFQRDWVWDDSHVTSLLASVTLSYPIGAVMMLQSGADDVKFKTRTVEGVDLTGDVVPEWLILDGQQRLTALYQALASPRPVTTRDLRGRQVSRHYHVDINAVLSMNGDREEAIFSVPEDRIRRDFRGQVAADYSTTEFQCTIEMLPLDIVFDTTKLNDWMMAYLNIDQEAIRERLLKWNRLQDEILKPIQQYQVPIIQLKKDTPKVAVCQVFEKVNTGGVSLTVFELLTATFAAEGFDLRKDWQAREHELKKKRVLRGIQNDGFLQVISLLVTKTRRDIAISRGVKQDQAPGISCKREAILRLISEDYQRWADIAQDGFVRAAKFLHLQKVYSHRDFPYPTQIAPLAAILASLHDRGETDGARQRIARWYWSGVFGELYGSSVESRFARDLPEVIGWIDNGAEPITVSDGNFAANRLLTLRTRNSAAYKGLYCLLLRDGGKDFRTGEPIDAQGYFEDMMDIHHVFPRSWCAGKGIPSSRYNSIVNKVALAAKTNRKIGGRAPSSYLKTLQREADISEDRMDEIVRSHAIDPPWLRRDDFDGFFSARSEALLERIERAMGKPIARDAGPLEADDDLVDDEMDEMTGEDEEDG